MYYAEIKYCDIANGPGVRTSLFVSGCTHHCPGCFNEIAWDFHYGQPFTKETEDAILDSMRPAYISGLTLLGGEPLEHENQKGLLPFLQRLRRELPDKTVWCYTGYTFESDVLGRMCREWPETAQLLKLFDILVDGRFVEAKKNISLQFRGSENQRVIDVPASLASGKTEIWKDLIR